MDSFENSQVDEGRTIEEMILHWKQEILSALDTGEGGGLLQISNSLGGLAAEIDNKREKELLQRLAKETFPMSIQELAQSLRNEPPSSDWEDEDLEYRVFTQIAGLGVDMNNPSDLDRPVTLDDFKGKNKYRISADKWLISFAISIFQNNENNQEQGIRKAVEDVMSS